MPDLTGLGDEEIKEVIEAMNEGMRNFYDTFKALVGTSREIYGEHAVTDKIVDYMLAISKEEITIEQAVKDYRKYLQDKRASEEEIMKSLGLPEYVETNLGDRIERWKLDCSEITDENGERKMVIEYILDCMVLKK